MTDNKTLILEDRHMVEEMYRFAKDLLADYSACKTELARSGLKKSLEMLIDKIGDAHARVVDAKVVLEQELEATKAKLPKTKEKISKILHEAGFHELEECEGGNWNHGLPSPDLTPKEYAELYRRLYGGMTKVDEKKLDKEIETFESKKVAEEAAQIKASEKILEEEKKNLEDDKELDESKKMSFKEVFDDMNTKSSKDSGLNANENTISQKIKKQKTKKVTTKKKQKQKA